MKKQNSVTKLGSTLNKNKESILVILALFLVWELSVRVFHIPEFILPTPSSALSHLFLPQSDANYFWLLHISVTVKEVLIGFVITSALGIFISLLMIWSPKFRGMVMPLFIFINSLPIVAIAPILLLWFGYGIRTNILISFLVSFFPVVVNTVAGLEDIDDDLLDLVRYLNASKWQVFTKIRIPNALPYIFSGLKICTTLSIMGAIVGEFIASDRGLGYIIINSQYAMDTPAVFASLIVISATGIVLYLIVSLIERLVMPWKYVKEVK